MSSESVKATEVVRKSKVREAERIHFLEETRDVEEARVFAARTLDLYRRAVVKRSAPAGGRVFRLRLLGSYCYLKRYIKGKPRDVP